MHVSETRMWCDYVDNWYIYEGDKDYAMDKEDRHDSVYMIFDLRVQWKIDRRVHMIIDRRVHLIIWIPEQVLGNAWAITELKRMCICIWTERLYMNWAFVYDLSIDIWTENNIWYWLKWSIWYMWLTRKMNMVWITRQWNNSATWYWMHMIVFIWLIRWTCVIRITYNEWQRYVCMIALERRNKLIWCYTCNW